MFAVFDPVHHLVTSTSEKVQQQKIYFSRKYLKKNGIVFSVNARDFVCKFNEKKKRNSCRYRKGTCRCIFWRRNFFFFYFFIFEIFPGSFGRIGPVKSHVRSDRLISRVNNPRPFFFSLCPFLLFQRTNRKTISSFFFLLVSTSFMYTRRDKIFFFYFFSIWTKWPVAFGFFFFFFK